MNLPTVMTFVMLASIMLWFIIAGKGRWYPKLGMIILTVVFSFFLYSAQGSFSGWPTAQKPPKEATLVGSVIIEPKAIFLWLVQVKLSGTPYEYTPDNGTPRAYQLPYSKRLHKEVQEAQEKQAKGRTIRAKYRSDDVSVKMHLYTLPPVGHPRKEVTLQP